MELGPFDKVVGLVQPTVLNRGSSFELILAIKDETNTVAINLTGHTVGIHSSGPTSLKDNMTIVYTDRINGLVTISLTKEQWDDAKVGESENWIKPMIDFSGGRRKVFPKIFLDMYS